MDMVATRALTPRAAMTRVPSAAKTVAFAFSIPPSSSPPMLSMTTRPRKLGARSALTRRTA